MHMSGPKVEHHVSLKMVFGFNAIQRTSSGRGPRSIDGFLFIELISNSNIITAGKFRFNTLPASIDSERGHERERRNPVPDLTKNSKTNKDEGHEPERVTASFSEGTSRG